MTPDVDQATATGFTIVYSVIFCTALAIAERRAAFQQHTISGLFRSVLLNAVLPTIFCFLVILEPPFAWDNVRQDILSVLVVAWYCAVPFGAMHVWLLSLYWFGGRLYKAAHEIDGEPAGRLYDKEDDLRRIIKPWNELRWLTAMCIAPILLQLFVMLRGFPSLL